MSMLASALGRVAGQPFHPSFSSFFSSSFLSVLPAPPCKMYRTGLRHISAGSQQISWVSSDRVAPYPSLVSFQADRQNRAHLQVAQGALQCGVVGVHARQGAQDRAQVVRIAQQVCRAAGVRRRRRLRP